MSRKDLINLKDRPPEERTAIARAGGLVKSDSKRLANMTKHLKHGRYAKKLTLRIQELASNPQATAYQIFELINAVECDWIELTPKLRMDLVRLYIDAHKAIHGTKNLNVNLNSVKEISELKDFLSGVDNDSG